MRHTRYGFALVQFFAVLVACTTIVIIAMQRRLDGAAEARVQYWRSAAEALAIGGAEVGFAALQRGEPMPALPVEELSGARGQVTFVDERLEEGSGALAACAEVRPNTEGRHRDHVRHCVSVDYQVDEEGAVALSGWSER